MNDMNDTFHGDDAQGMDDRSRRRFFQVAIGTTAAVSGVAMIYPLYSFFKLPKSLGPVSLMEVPLDQLIEGQGIWGEHKGKQIVVIKKGDEIRAFDGECTHLGCIVKWEADKQMFFCPCHGGKFDDMGNPIGGPVNKPLHRVAFVVEEGVLSITDAQAQT